MICFFLPFYHDLHTKKGLRLVLSSRLTDCPIHLANHEELLPFLPFHHGSVKNGCISNRIATFQISRHFLKKAMIMGERVFVWMFLRFDLVDKGGAGWKFSTKKHPHLLVKRRMPLPQASKQSELAMSPRTKRT